MLNQECLSQRLYERCNEEIAAGEDWGMDLRNALDAKDLIGAYCFVQSFE